jgi:competence protein ComGC
MKCRMVNQRNAAFGLTEFLIAIVCALVLVLLILPSIPREKEQSPRVKCTINLKQVALSYALWSQDNEQGFPMETPASKGGIRELALAGDLLSTVRIASNQMRTTSILLCPAEKKRKVAETFASLTTANISYFINVDAALTNQNHILAGDRNLALGGIPVRSGFLELTDPYTLSWTKGSESHDHAGNVALVDGSAHQVTTKGFRDLLTLGGPTNRLIIP